MKIGLFSSSSFSQELAKAFHQAGHQAETFTEYERLKIDSFDVFISERTWTMPHEQNVLAKLKYAYLSDVENTIPLEMPEWLTAFDTLAFAQKAALQKFKDWQVPMHKVFSVFPGIWPPHPTYPVTSILSAPPKVYGLAHDKDLLSLLPLFWPQIQAAVPAAELILIEVASFPKVTTKLEYIRYVQAEEMETIDQIALQSRVFLNFQSDTESTQQHIMRAMAHGCIILGVAHGMLPLIAWRNPLYPRSPGYLEECQKDLLLYLTDNDHFADLSAQNLSLSKRFAWRQVAQSWLLRIKMDFVFRNLPLPEAL